MLDLRSMTLALAVAASGCAFDSSSSAVAPDSDLADPQEDELPGEGNQSPPLLIDCTEWQPPPKHVDPCALGGPQGTLQLSAGTYVYDTDSSVLTMPDGTPRNLPGLTTIAGANVLFLDDIIVGRRATLRAVGSRALVLAAWNSATIDGWVDVSSETGGPVGAGAGLGCLALDTIHGNGDPKGGAGGAGGSLLQIGGRGAEGASDAGGGPPAGGEPAVIVTGALDFLGGCPGGSGGFGTAQDDLGAGGPGGGSVVIAARGPLAVGGGIAAGGAGGHSGKDFGGGGGGGTGGLIGLDAVNLTVTGVLFVDGGGGGAGASHGVPGRSGAAAVWNRQSSSAGGSAQHGHSGNGGRGSRCQATAQNGGVSEDDKQDAGGGGGGAAGLILARINGSLTDATATHRSFDEELCD